MAEQEVVDLTGGTPTCRSDWKEKAAPTKSISDEAIEAPPLGGGDDVTGDLFDMYTDFEYHDGAELTAVLPELEFLSDLKPASRGRAQFRPTAVKRKKEPEQEHTEDARQPKATAARQAPQKGGDVKHHQEQAGAPRKAIQPNQHPQQKPPQAAPLQVNSDLKQKQQEATAKSAQKDKKKKKNRGGKRQKTAEQQNWHREDQEEPERGGAGGGQGRGSKMTRPAWLTRDQAPATKKSVPFAKRFTTSEHDRAQGREPGPRSKSCLDGHGPAHDTEAGSSHECDPARRSSNFMRQDQRRQIGGRASIQMGGRGQAGRWGGRGPRSAMDGRGRQTGRGPRLTMGRGGSSNGRQVWEETTKPPGRGFDGRQRSSSASEQQKLEAEANHRRKELDALASAQSTKQKQLDAQTVALQCRERDLDAREKEVENAHNRLAQEIEAQRVESERILEDKRREMQNERVEIDQLTATKKYELNLLRIEQERELKARRRAMDAAHQELDTRVRQINSLRENVDRELGSQRMQIEAERKAQRTVMLANQQEIEDRVALIIRQQAELDAQIAEQKARETSWEESKARFEALHETKEIQLDAQAAANIRQHKELLSLRRKVESEQAKHQKDLQVWSVTKAKKQEEAEAWIKASKACLSKKQAELDARSLALTKQKNELTVRATALKRRVSETKASEATKRKNKVNQENPEQNDENATNLSGIKAATDVSRKKARKGPEGQSATGSESGPNPEDQSSSKNNNGQDFVLVDDESVEDGSGAKPKGKAQATRPTAKSTTARVRLPKTSATEGASATAVPRRAPAEDTFRFNYEENYNYNLSGETAFEMQERLFREAAAKMHTQASVRVAQDGSGDSSMRFTKPIFDIAERHPEHWTWKDPHAVLGLPPNSSLQLVKSQFRRLARTYHPDKSDASNTSSKFHSVRTSYHKIVENP